MHDLELLPADKHDLLRARNAVHAGYPAVEPVLYELLTWLQDINWPVARELAPFLAGIGAPLAPHLRAILQTDDQVWKYHLIRHVIARSQDLKSAFEADLRRLAKAPSQSESLEELHLAAREALSGPEA